MLQSSTWLPNTLIVQCWWFRSPATTDESHLVKVVGPWPCSLSEASDPHMCYHFKSSFRLPPYIKPLRQRGEKGMDLCFCLLLCPHRKLLTSLQSYTQVDWRRGTVWELLGKLFQLCYSFLFFTYNFWRFFVCCQLLALDLCVSWSRCCVSTECDMSTCSLLSYGFKTTTLPHERVFRN